MATDETPTPQEDEEIKTFVLHEHKLKTIDGDSIALPKCSWRVELKIIALLKDIVKKVIESGVLSAGSNIDPQVTVKAAQAQLRIQSAQDAETDPDPEDVKIVGDFNRLVTADNAKTITKIAEEILEDGPEKLTEAVMILSGQDREWVETKLQSEEMLGLVLPFLASKSQTITNKIGKYIGKIGVITTTT